MESHCTPELQSCVVGLELVQRFDVMKLDLSIGRPVLQQSPASTSIWISDFLLAESIQRFTCVHRRHGSSVPGPLEARRRATRRRSTSLASVGPSGPPIDVGSLFGPGRSCEWWNVPNSSAPQAAVVEPLSLLPSWLTRKTPSTSPKIPLREQLAQGGHFSSQEIPVAREATDRFQNLLCTCQSLEEIRDTVRRLEVNVSQTPIQSRQILKHLLSSDWGVSALHEFILDARLHTPDSSCFKELFQWLIATPQPEVHLKGFYACVESSLNLGLVSEREVVMLITKLADVKIDLHGVISRLGDTKDIQTWYWMMVNAMRTCTIFGLKELSQNHLQQWCFRISEAPFAPCALDTFGMIQRHFARSDWLIVDTMQGLIRKSITHVQRAQHEQPQNPIGTHDEVIPEYENIAICLAAAQPAVAAKCICRVSEKLVRDVMKGLRQPTALNIWMQILSHGSIRSSDIIWQQRIWKGGLGDADTPERLSSRQALVIRLWTVSQVATFSPKAPHSLALQRLTRHLMRLFERKLKPDQELLAELIFTFQSLPLPSPSAVLQQVAKSSSTFVHFQGSIDKLQADLLSVTASRIALFKEDDTYKNARINLNNHVSHLAERTNANPEAFRQMAHALIMRDKFSIKIITRILQNNLPQKICLAHASNPVQRESDKSGTTTCSTTDPLTPLTPAIALHLLNSLARSFALSPELSPRQSFRKVYWIYLYIHRYTAGTGIGPEITRPMWHAGVTRYKETGTSPEKVKWILEKVREVEGNEVADRLLWFGAGGVKGWEDWMKEGCGGLDVKGWKRVVWKKMPVQKEEEEEQGQRAQQEPDAAGAAQLDTHT